MATRLPLERRDPLLPDAGTLVERVVGQFGSAYLGPEGLIATQIDGRDGSILDAEPLIADFGDVLPFLIQFGAADFAFEQVERARPRLAGGLYRDASGAVKLFSNHDWLLGLIELYEMTGDREFLDTAATGARSIIRDFTSRGRLIDETVSVRRPRSILQRSSAFNLGYIELFIDLAAMTGDGEFLAASGRLADAAFADRYYRAHHVFGTNFCSWSPLVDRAASRFAGQQARLFKDNTNAAWSLLALCQARGHEGMRAALLQWLDGFKAAFLVEGETFLWRDRSGPRDPSLKAAFASIDLMCDLHLAGMTDKPIALARSIADRWLPRQWRSGGFPEIPGGEGDHIDCNTDMTVALMKLAAVSGDQRYADAARRCGEAVLNRKGGRFGLAQSVSAAGDVIDPRIIVKYQALALKLAMLPEDPRKMIADASLLKLLRDR